MAITPVGNAVLPSVRAPATAGPVQARPAVTAATASETPQTQAPVPDRRQVEQVVAQVAHAVKPTAANKLQFSIDEETGRTVIRVVDEQTGETIRQIPSEEIMAIARNLDRLQGLLVHQEA